MTKIHCRWANGHEFCEPVHEVLAAAVLVNMRRRYPRLAWWLTREDA